jgi:hypothetical protein
MGSERIRRRLPTEVPILEQQVEIEEMHLTRILDAWDDLVRRVVSG